MENTGLTNPYDVTNSALDYASDYSNDTIGQSIIGNFLMPGYQQQAEYGQQVALQQMQNDWSVKGKMAAGIEAGINPHTMAAGIAGAGTPSTGSPNSAIGAGAQGVGAASQAANSVAGGLDSAMNAYEKLSLTGVEKQKRSAETVSALQAAGLSYWEAKAIETMLPDRQKNLQADTYLKIANFKNTCEEYHNIVLEHDRRKADIDRIQKEAYLAEQQGNLAEAQKLKVDAETAGIELDNWWKTTDKEFWENHGYRQDDGMDIALRNAAANGKTEAAEAVGKAIEDSSYNQQKGVNRAEIEDGYKKAFEEAKANADVAAMFKEFNVDVDTWSQIFIDMYESILENPSSIKGVAAKFINSISNLLNGSIISAHNQGSPSGNRVGPHDKPAAGGKYGQQ